MHLTSVFRKPDGTLFHYPMQCRTLEEEKSQARRFDGNSEFGQYLYSRPVAQVPLQMTDRYRFSLKNGRFRYQRIDEAMPGQFDYVNLSGDHLGTCVLPVDCLALVLGIEYYVSHLLHFELRSVRSFKFQDLMETHVFSVVLEDRQAKLKCFASEDAELPEISIPLHFPDRANS